MTHPDLWRTIIVSPKMFVQYHRDCWPWRRNPVRRARFEAHLFWGWLKMAPLRLRARWLMWRDPDVFNSGRLFGIDEGE